MTSSLVMPNHFMGYKANNDSNLTQVTDLLQENKMDYNVVKVPAQYEFDGKTFTPEKEFHLVNGNTGECLSRSTVSNVYTPMSPMDIANDFQWFVDAGYASPFAAFRTGSGVETIALLLDPDLFDGIEGYAGFILGQNAQGGKGATGSLYVWRQVCSNGMMGWATDSRFSIAHRGNVAQKFAARTREWAKIQSAFQAMDRRMSELSGVPMTFKGFQDATDELLGTYIEGGSVIDSKTGKPASTRKLNRRERILQATNMPAMGTHGASAADFYNAVTYIISHAAPGSKRSQAAVADSLLGGSGFSLERKALAILGS